jgi:hypothetical protein
MGRGRGAWDGWCGHSVSMENRGNTISLGQDGPGQLSRKGFRRKPEKEKREASKFDWTICDKPMAPNIVTSIEYQEKCSDSRSVAGNLSQYPIQFGTFSF